jgi:cyanate permease
VQRLLVLTHRSARVWGAPALITAGVLAAIVPRHDIAAAGQGGDWRPDWRNIRVWKLGLLQATATLGYFGGSTFIPGYLHATHRPELVAAALAGLSLGQLPGVLLFGLLPASRLTNARPALILGSGMLVALATLLIASGLGFVLAAALLGACSAAALALALALPPLVAAPTDVPRACSQSRFSQAHWLAPWRCCSAPLAFRPARWSAGRRSVSGRLRAAAPELRAARESVDRPRQQVERIRDA